MKICIDIGGTQIRVAQINQELELFDLLVFQTTTPTSMIDSVIEYLSDKEFKQINISTCGPIDIKSGIYGSLPNLKGWENFNIRGSLAQYVDCNILIENDANCATLFESTQRPDINNLVYITLSTGVGAGAVINGKLLTGPTNDAVSPYKYYTNPSTTLEQKCSGNGLLKLAQNIECSIKETKEIFEPSNKTLMEPLIDQWTTDLALFIVNVQAVLETEQIVLGGSVIVNNANHLQQIVDKMSLMNCNINIEITNEEKFNALKGAFLIDELYRENDEESTRNI